MLRSMATKPRQPFKTPVPSSKEAQERYLFLDDVIRRVRPEGFSIDEMESALGMYMLGFHVGWKVLYLVHSKRTIRKYEELLGIKVKEIFPEIGPDADRTMAFKVIEAASNFWKAVSGEDKPLGEVNKRSVIS